MIAAADMPVIIRRCPETPNLLPRHNAIRGAQRTQLRGHACSIASESVFNNRHYLDGLERPIVAPSCSDGRGAS